MGSKKGKDFIGFSAVTLNGNQDTNTHLLYNPATVAGIYRNAMKIPGEILVSQIQANTKSKHEK